MKSKKIDIKDIIFMSVIAVMLVLVIVSLFIPFITQSMIGHTGNISLFNLPDMAGALTKVFAILTLVTLAISLILTGLRSFGIFTGKIYNITTYILNALLILFALLTFVFTMIFVAQKTSDLSTELLKVSFYPTIGAYMLPIAGIIGGISGLLTTKKF